MKSVSLFSGQLPVDEIDCSELIAKNASSKPNSTRPACPSAGEISTVFVMLPYPLGYVRKLPLFANMCSQAAGLKFGSGHEFSGGLRLGVRGKTVGNFLTF